MYTSSSVEIYLASFNFSQYPYSLVKDLCLLNQTTNGHLDTVLANIVENNTVYTEETQTYAKNNSSVIKY